MRFGRASVGLPRCSWRNKLRWRNGTRLSRALAKEVRQTLKGL